MLRCIMKKFSSTLIFNLLLMLILVMGVLWGLFQFLPKTAHIVVEPCLESEIESISTNKVDLIVEAPIIHIVSDVYLSDSQMKTYFNNDIEREFGRSIHDELLQEYLHDYFNEHSGSYRIVSTQMSTISVSIRKNAIVTISGVEHVAGANTKIQCSSTGGVQGFSIIPATGNMVFRSRLLADNIEDRLVTFFPKAMNLVSYQHLSMDFENSIQIVFPIKDAILSLGDGSEPIPIKQCELSFPAAPTSDYPSNLSHDLEIDGVSFANIASVVDNSGSKHASVVLSGLIHDFSNIVSGKLWFSLSPVAKEIDLKWSKVDIASKEGLTTNLTFVEGKVDKGNIYGRTEAAQISGMDLFPTFQGWYRDNIYITPLALITIVFGGLTLMLNKHKKERLDGEQSFPETADQKTIPSKGVVRDAERTAHTQTHQRNQ